MSRKRFTAAQIIAMLREAAVTEDRNQGDKAATMRDEDL